MDIINGRPHDEPTVIKTGDRRSTVAQHTAMSLDPAYQMQSAEPPATDGEARWRWRQERIRALRAELQSLLDEEALAYGSKVDLASLKDECRRLKSSGQTLTAIKLYRSKTGLSLLEAKDAVDGLH